MKWYKNNLTKALNIKYPIIQAPMASAASIELATSVSNAGGLGSLGLSYYKLENIRSDTTMRDSIADTGSEPNSEDPVDDN